MNGFGFEDEDMRSKTSSGNGLEPLTWEVPKADSERGNNSKEPEVPDGITAMCRAKPPRKPDDAEITVTVPDLKNMEEYIFAHCRDSIVAELNECLYNGELSQMIEMPVLSQSIMRDKCRLVNYRFWRMNQVDILADVEIILQDLSVEGKDGDFISSFGIYVTLWFSADNDFEFIIQDVGPISEYPDRDLTKLDKNLIPVFGRESIEESAEAMWIGKVPDAMNKPDLRRAFILAKACGLQIDRQRLADSHDVDHVLFFQNGIALVQDEAEKGTGKLPPPRPIEVAARTIVLNLACDSYDENALAIYKACFEYEWYYCFFAFNDYAHSRLDQFGIKSVTVKGKKNRPRNVLPFVSSAIHLGGMALMMPITIMRDRVWREYQRASLQKALAGNYINHDGFRYAQVIQAISEEFKVARYRVRQRIIGMGRYRAKGANNYDPDANRCFTPFSFDEDDNDMDIVQRDENGRRIDTAFAINRHGLFRLYRRDGEFRSLMSTGDFAFIDGLVCVNDSSFIQPCESGFRMTAAANAHVDLCCLRFDTRYVRGRCEHFFSSEGFNQKYADLSSLHCSVTNSERSMYRKMLLDNIPESFPDALRYMMANGPAGCMNQTKLAKRSGLKETTIADYYANPKRLYTLDEVVAICVGLSLPPWLSRVLVDKANLCVPEGSAQIHYGMILDCLYLDSIKPIQTFLLRNRIKVLQLDNFNF